MPGPGEGEGVRGPMLTEERVVVALYARAGALFSCSYIPGANINVICNVPPTADVFDFFVLLSLQWPDFMFISTGGIARPFGHCTIYSLIKQIMQQAKGVQLIVRFAKCCIISRKCWIILVGRLAILRPPGGWHILQFFSGRRDSISAGRSIRND